jgi:hypothetical protein
MTSTQWVFAAVAWTVASSAAIYGLECLKSIRATLFRIEGELVRARRHRQGPRATLLRIERELVRARRHRKEPTKRKTTPPSPVGG